MMPLACGSFVPFYSFPDIGCGHPSLFVRLSYAIMSIRICRFFVCIKSILQRRLYCSTTFSVKIAQISGKGQKTKCVEWWGKGLWVKVLRILYLHGYGEGEEKKTKCAKGWHGCYSGMTWQNGRMTTAQRRGDGARQRPGGDKTHRAVRGTLRAFYSWGD